MRILVTGGAGFIGSAVCREIIGSTAHHCVNLDKLTYAANLHSLDPVSDDPRYRFIEGDICDRALVEGVLREHEIDAVMNLAAESHVDRSITGPADFIQTNIIGTYTMVEAARAYWSQLPEDRRDRFRFMHISTDEVYGSLGAEGLFTETTAYDPSSPYSASKASSDHLVMAWHRTYGLPVLLTNCSNNYGPYHFPEKLIPLIITNALDGKELPVYGKGENVRDWLYVEDHARALLAVVEKGVPGESYNVGGNAERRNIDVVHGLCDALDRHKPRSDGKSYREQIRFVTDRPGHDFRYAIDASKIKAALGWEPRESFDSGLDSTVRWYLEREDWWRPLQQRYSGQRLGLVDKKAG